MKNMAPWLLGTFLLGTAISSYSGGAQLWRGAFVVYAFIFAFNLLRQKINQKRMLINPEIADIDTVTAHIDEIVPQDLLEVNDLEITEASIVPLENSFAVSSQQAQGRLTKNDWDYLIRNAQDGGTNSILASHVLKKTSLILVDGNVQALEMKVQAEEVFSSAQEMLKFVGEIRSIAKSAKVVAFNLMVEAGRHDSSSGGAIMVVAKEMANLSENTNKLTVRMEQSVTSVSQVASNNQKKCASVSALFTQIEAELNQFKFLMARIEDLSISQCEKIKGFEDNISL